jgi:hypothetical protein
MLVVSGFHCHFFQANIVQDLRANVYRRVCPHRSTRAIQCSRDCQSRMFRLRMVVIGHGCILTMLRVFLMRRMGNLA